MRRHLETKLEIGESDVILVSSGFEIQNSIFAVQDSGFKLEVQDSNNFDNCNFNGPPKVYSTTGRVNNKGDVYVKRSTSSHNLYFQRASSYK